MRGERDTAKEAEGIGGNGCSRWAFEQKLVLGEGHEEVGMEEGLQRAMRDCRHCRRASQDRMATYSEEEEEKIFVSKGSQGFCATICLSLRYDKIKYYYYFLLLI